MKDPKSKEEPKRKEGMDHPDVWDAGENPSKKRGYQPPLLPNSLLTLTSIKDTTSGLAKQEQGDG